MGALIETVLTVDSIEFAVVVIEKQSRASTHCSGDLQIVQRCDVHDHARPFHLQIKDKAQFRFEPACKL